MADFDRKPFEKFAQVSLLRPIEVQGIRIPAGSHGVVIAAWAGGLACEVEFDEPRHLLVTIKAANLTVTMPNATKPESIRISSFICSIRRVVILYPARLRLFRAQELIDALKRYLSEPSAR